MPSKPLFGRPVAVGISDAVMAMRSVVSAITEGDASKPAISASVQDALRRNMNSLPSTHPKIRLDQEKIRANFRPAREAAGRRDAVEVSQKAASARSLRQQPGF